METPYTLTVGTPFMVQKWLEIYARRSGQPIFPYTAELQDDINAMIDGKENKWKIVDVFIRSLYGLPPAKRY